VNPQTFQTALVIFVMSSVCILKNVGDGGHPWLVDLLLIFPYLSPSISESLLEVPVIGLVSFLQNVGSLFSVK
jgi:hypothetical protein